ncbi:hypothetical protein Rhow_004662 [Rhodococcus wratislaviensis]|uniref:Uncharacterized protein n=1 Tax=Rhodococcus wratislaviensis TaxID=44752 RepID=A0A402CBP0_RHOWR|nr:hypothetical protein Rhow_004662 [Rhodococcus wratislaviensis]
MTPSTSTGSGKRTRHSTISGALQWTVALRQRCRPTVGGNPTAPDCFPVRRPRDSSRQRCCLRGRLLGLSDMKSVDDLRRNPATGGHIEALADRPLPNVLGRPLRRSLPHRRSVRRGLPRGRLPRGRLLRGRLLRGRLLRGCLLHSRLPRSDLLRPSRLCLNLLFLSVIERFYDLCRNPATGRHAETRTDRPLPNLIGRRRRRSLRRGRLLHGRRRHNRLPRGYLLSRLLSRSDLLRRTPCCLALLGLTLLGLSALEGFHDLRRNPTARGHIMTRTDRPLANLLGCPRRRGLPHSQSFRRSLRCDRLLRGYLFHSRLADGDLLRRNPCCPNLLRLTLLGLSALEGIHDLRRNPTTGRHIMTRTDRPLANLPGRLRRTFRTPRCLGHFVSPSSPGNRRTHTVTANFSR